MQRLTAANHVTSMHWSPQADRSPGTVQRGGACGVRGCQRPSLGRLTYEGLSAAYPAMTVA